MSRTGLIDPPAAVRGTGGGKLLSLEAGRAAAALLVTGYHVEGLCQKYFGGYGLDNIFRGGYAGVDYFFVLSGFIIAITHRADIGRKRALYPFLMKRAIRILPMYWLVLGLMVAAFLAVPGWTGGVAHLTPQLVIADALLLPTQVPQILQPAWTLQREALFYLLFALLIVRPRTGAVLFALWQIGIIASMALDLFPFASVGDIFLGPHNLGFAGGMLIAWLSGRKNPNSAVGHAALGVGLFLFIGLLAMDWHLGRDTVGIRDNFGYRAGTLLYTGAAMLTIFGLVEAERQGRLKIPGWVAAMGGASYLIYLLHEPLSSLLTKVMLKSWFPLPVPAGGAYAAYLVGTLTAAFFLHKLVEKPFLNILRTRLIANRKKRP